MAHSVDLFKMNPAVAVRLTDPELMGDCNVVEEFLEALPDYCVKDAADLSESTFAATIGEYAGDVDHHMGAMRSLTVPLAFKAGGRPGV